LHQKVHSKSCSLCQLGFGEPPPRPSAGRTVVYTAAEPEGSEVTEKDSRQAQGDRYGGGYEVDRNDDSRLKKETAIGSDRRGRGS
jgi:hypothetical protein